MSETLDWRPAHEADTALNPDGLHVWLMDLDAAPPEYRSNLSAEEVRQQSRYLDTGDGRRYAVARGAMRGILGSYLGVPGRSITFRYGPLGKPRIHYPKGSGLEFNLSHCRTSALLAVTRTSSVGVDLEVIRPRINSRRIAQRVFAPSVYDAINELPEPLFLSAFYAHWTALEARVKCRGQGVFGEPDPRVEAVNFHPGAGQIAAIAMPVEIPPSAEWGKFRLAG